MKLADAREHDPASQEEDVVQGAVNLPLSLKRLLIDTFSAADLRHLAYLKEASSPQLTARQRLDEAGVDELAEMLVAGRRPTLGWWRRHADCR